MSFSNFLEDELLDHVFGGAAYTAPTNIYVKLHIGDPGEDGTANAAGETTRVEATFGAASAGVISNDAAVEWTDVSTTEEYTHGSVWDDPTAGNNLGSGAFGTSVSVTAGDNFTIPVGDLDISLD